MSMFWLIIFSFLVCIYDGVEAGASSMRHIQAHKERQKKRLGSLRPGMSRQTTINLYPPAHSPYYNDATAKFAVNGSGFPDIDFDIGESYAGMLPVDDG